MVAFICSKTCFFFRFSILNVSTVKTRKLTDSGLISKSSRKINMVNSFSGKALTFSMREEVTPRAAQEVVEVSIPLPKAIIMVSIDNSNCDPVSLAELFATSVI